MWGEFEGDENEKKSEELDASASPELCRQSEDPEVVLSLPPLRDRLIHYMAASTIILKSQQRYEPDLTYQERKDIVQKLLDQKPGQFLYRFGKQLEREHLQYFLKYEGDAEVDHYLTEALKHKNEHTKKITVLNRRYSALQKLRRSGDYFSEKEMERRNPLLYDQLIGKHQTSEEREDKYKIDKSDVK
ncbi:Coiled-coil domain-containing protein 97-like 1 [Homarus americanus]|uniref:Coiled-coil domain-containing protein 97-like 1 n=3 Tax=Homarus americanus TaxID=6706 RepID=A0A8J5J9X6_HOMAM|nr:Coiled-coil domain-containing protein 97-like 1 [Homarus americanus]